MTAAIYGCDCGLRVVGMLLAVCAGGAAAGYVIAWLLGAR